MVRVASLCVAVLLAAGSAASQVVFQTGPGVPAQPPPARDASQRTGTARIRGRVFDAQSGQPLRKAQVRAFSPELRDNRLATTDTNGAYEFKDLVAGRYNLTAAKGSFVQLAYGQTRPFEQGRPLEIADGATIEKIDFSLPHGSVVTGRILDDFGDPAADVQVIAMRYQYIQGRRRLTPAGRASMTNDLGEFRIFGLPPGQYYLSATLRGMGMMMDASSDDRSGYAPTYYPGTPNAAEAQRVTISLGQTLTDLNMALVQARIARVSGTAVDSNGKPMTGGFIMVMQRNGAMTMANGGGQIRPDGTFSVSNLAPGEYTLMAQVRGPLMPGENESASARVTIAGEDIEGVQLVATKPITATGRILADPAALSTLRPSMLSIALAALNPDEMMMGPAGMGKVNDDFSFELKARPGRHLIRLNAANAALGLTTKAVRYNGVDVTDSGFEFRPDEDVSGFEIELASHPTEVSGVVTNPHGDVSKDYTVLLFAQDSQKWGFLSRYVSSGRPDQDGRFKVRNLPAGSYCAVAMDYIEPGEATDPEFLERVQPGATTFSLNEGETKTLDLKLTSLP